MKPEDLVTYCGSYGGICGQWCENVVLRDFATKFLELVDAMNFQYWLPEDAEFDYSEFRKGLNYFSKNDTGLICRKCCKGGDGNDECKIRICCRERGLDLCFDCSEFPCDTVKENTKMIEEQAIEYKKLGRDMWLRKQVEKAKQGFEGHAEKYYKIWAEKYPPSQTKNE